MNNLQPKDKLQPKAPLLRGKIEKKIKRIIKSIPSKEIERLRIGLLQRWKQKKGTTAIFPKPRIKKYPGLYFWGIICKDWPGAAGTIMGVVTESDWDIATHWGMSVFIEREKVGVIIVGIEIKKEEKLIKFLNDRGKIRKKLYEVCAEGWRKRELLIHDVKKMEKLEDVMGEIKERGKFTEGIAEEVIKFFNNRSEEYLEQRIPRDLADIILTNYGFIHSIRKSGGEPQVKVKRLKTSKEVLTGITIGCYEDKFSLLLALDAIGEAVPGYNVKYNKQFITDDKIAIYRIEIAGFQPERRIEHSIRKKLGTMEYGRRGVGEEVARGFEHYGKAIIPRLIKEHTLVKIPQVYISPEIASPGFIHFKLIIVKGVDSPWIDKYVAHIEKVKGITVTGCETPKVYQESEVSVLDLRAETEIFSSGEFIYIIIKQKLTEILGEFRDFGEGMRKIDIDRFGKVRRGVKGVKLSLLKEFYYGIEDFCRVGSTDEEIIELVKLGVKLALGKVSDIKWSIMEDRCTLLGIASKENMLPSIVKMLEGYDTIVSKIRLGNLIFLLLKVEDQGRALSNEKLFPIIHTIAKRLEIPENKLWALPPHNLW